MDALLSACAFDEIETSGPNPYVVVAIGMPLPAVAPVPSAGFYKSVRLFYQPGEFSRNLLLESHFTPPALLRAYRSRPPARARPDSQVMKILAFARACTSGTRSVEVLETREYNLLCYGGNNLTIWGSGFTASTPP